MATPYLLRNPKTGRTPYKVTQEWVVTMLREAGAPEPWARPEEVQQLTLTISAQSTLSCVVTLHLPETTLDEGDIATRKGIEHRAQAAIDELHRVLPPLIEAAEATAAGPRMRIFSRKGRGPTVDLNAEAASEADALLRLYGALVPISSVAKRRALDRARETIDGSKPRRRSPETASWHRAALAVFDGYAKVVGHASTSKNSNAVKFVGSVLFHIGEGTHTPSSIAQALVRAGVTTRRSAATSG